MKMRQSRLRFCALFLAAAQTLRAAGDGESVVAREVQAARAQALALGARMATAEEWQMLERSLADLAARHPDEASVRIAQAEVRWQRDDRESAIRAWEEAEKLAPNDVALLAQLADAHLAVGGERQCVHYFSKASALAPTDARLRHATGNALFLFRHALVDTRRSEAQVIDEALAHFAAAARLAPENADYARAYAETFYGAPKPDWAAALAAWQHYLAVTPNRDFAHVNLARVRMRMGQFDAAQEELKMIQGTGFEGFKSRMAAQIASARKAAELRAVPRHENLESDH